MGARTVAAAPAQHAAAAQEHADRGRQLIGRGELAPAERELRKAVDLAPGSAEFLGLLGVVLGMCQKLQESDLYLEKALRLDPADSALRRNLAWNQFELGQLAPAKINLDRVLKENPRDSVATLLMGMIEEERKQYETAVKLLESVPVQVQERPESVAALARAYYHTGRRQKSREILKQLNQQSAEPKRIFVAGEVAAEIHEFDIAEALFQSLSAIYPDKAELSYALAGCVAKTILSAKPNQPPILSVDYSAFNPRSSRKNWICPRISPFGDHLTWPFRIMGRTS